MRRGHPVLRRLRTSCWAVGPAAHREPPARAKFMRPGLSVDLSFDQWRIDVPWADRVASDAFFRGLECCDLGQADDAVLRGDIGRFEWRRDQSVRGGDV